MDIWKEFHEYWLSAEIPVHIVRYEDLRLDPEPVLKKLLEFILEVDDISGTVVHANLKKTVSEAPPQKYKPRKAQINKN
jgi:hypothetical protein